MQTKEYGRKPKRITITETRKQIQVEQTIIRKSRKYGDSKKD